METYKEVEKIIRSCYENNPKLLKKTVNEVLPKIIGAVNANPNNPAVNEVINHVNGTTAKYGGSEDLPIMAVTGIIALAMILGFLHMRKNIKPRGSILIVYPRGVNIEGFVEKTKGFPNVTFLEVYKGMSGEELKKGLKASSEIFILFDIFKPRGNPPLGFFPEVAPLWYAENMTNDKIKFVIINVDDYKLVYGATKTNDEIDNISTNSARDMRFELYVDSDDTQIEFDKKWQNFLNENKFVLL